MCNNLVDIYEIGYIKPSSVHKTKKSNCYNFLGNLLKKVIVIIFQSISSYHIGLCKVVCGSIIIAFSTINILYYLAHAHPQAYIAS